MSWRRSAIREFIRAINREHGTTIILTTHDLGDVEKLCERVVMIDRGHLVFDGALETLRRRFGEGRVLVVHFETLPPGLSVAGADLVRTEANRAWLLVGGDTTGNGGGAAGGSVAGGSVAGGSMADVVAQLFQRYRVLDLSVQEPEIEEVVRRIYEGHLLGG